MENPFESGHIKNYLLLYASVVVIMILFFIASSLFNDIKTLDKKVFVAETSEKNISQIRDKTEENQPTDETPKFRLLEKAY